MSGTGNGTLPIPTTKAKQRAVLWELILEMEEMRGRLANMIVAARDMHTQMHNRKPIYPKAKANTPPSTPTLKQQVRAFKRANPTMHNREIARRFGVDGGRITDWTRGIRV
jgi:hypothetical protein